MRGWLPQDDFDALGDGAEGARGRAEAVVLVQALEVGAHAGVRDQDGLEGQELVEVVVGLGLIAHGANLILLGSGGEPGDPPIIDGSSTNYSDPLEQALVLTAIVITFGITAFLLALAFRFWTDQGSDEVEDDIEDRRIALKRDRQ